MTTTGQNLWVTAIDEYRAEQHRIEAESAASAAESLRRDAAYFTERLRDMGIEADDIPAEIGARLEKDGITLIGVWGEYDYDIYMVLGRCDDCDEELVSYQIHRLADIGDVLSEPHTGRHQGGACPKAPAKTTQTPYWRQAELHYDAATYQADKGHHESAAFTIQCAIAAALIEIAKNGAVVREA